MNGRIWSGSTGYRRRRFLAGPGAATKLHGRSLEDLAALFRGREVAGEADGGLCLGALAVGTKLLAAMAFPVGVEDREGEVRGGGRKEK